MNDKQEFTKKELFLIISNLSATIAGFVLGLTLGMTATTTQSVLGLTIFFVGMFIMNRTNKKFKSHFY